MAELLIALAILGVIATFAIPKVLQSQQDGKYKAMAKEAVAAVSEAYHAYKLKNQVTSSMNAAALAPYFNYVKYDTSSLVDGSPSDSATYPCNPTSPCLLMHNGGLLYLYATQFGALDQTRVIWFLFDPDGKSGSSTNLKSIWFAMYVSGRVTSWATIDPGSTDSGGGTIYNPDPTKDPAWFSWN